MLKRISYEKFILIFIHLSITLNFIHIGQIQAQGRFMLTEVEMPGYELIMESPFVWLIGEKGETHDIIQQKWHYNEGSNTKELVIEYCEFNDEVNAIQGTAFSSHSFATPFLWDSPNGSILGDGTWTAITGGAMFFVRANVGIKMHFDDLLFSLNISDKIMNKIEMNLSSMILSFEEAARQKQIPTTNYTTIVNPLIESAGMHDFKPYSTWDSKWLMDTQNLTMGVRKEWKDDKGAVVSIDIGKVDTEALARGISEIRRQHIPTPRVYDLSELDTLYKHIEALKEQGNQKISYNMLGQKGNLTVHLYHYNPEYIDWDFFLATVEKLAEQILNF